MRLKQRESLIEGAPPNFRFEEVVDDCPGLSRRGNEGSWAVLDGRAEPCAAEFDGKEGLMAGCLVQLPAKDERESGELEIVEVVVRSEKMGGVAGAETIGQFGEGVAVAKEGELNLGVIEGGEEIKDLIDLSNAPVDDVLGVSNIADWAAEKNEAAIGGARDETIKGIRDVDSRR